MKRMAESILEAKHVEEVNLGIQRKSWSYWLSGFELGPLLVC